MGFVLPWAGETVLSEIGEYAQLLFSPAQKSCEPRARGFLLFFLGPGNFKAGDHPGVGHGPEGTGCDVDGE